MTYNDFFNLAKEKGLETIQITEETVIGSETIVLNESLEDYSTINKVTYSVKAEKNNKTEKLSTDYLDETIIDLLIEKLDNTDSNYQDNYLDNKRTDNINKNVNITINKEVEKLKGFNKLKNNYKHITNLENYYTESYEKTRIINNKDTDISTDSHTYKYIVEATAKDNNEVANYSKSILTTNKEEIDFETLANIAMERAELSLNKQKLETKKYNILIDSSVVSSIISRIAAMLSAESIRQKTSCLANSINQKKFSDKLTIVEMPLDNNHPGYTAFDNEGTTTINKTIIDKGIIKTYLYNNKEANIENISSTGNGYDSISTRNMYIEPSTKSIEDIIKSIKDGIYVTDFMGSQNTAISCSTGNISLQIFGFIIIDGKIVSSFIPCIMTTTIFELFSNIEEIASDLTFEKKTSASPSILVSNISVAAE